MSNLAKPRYYIGLAPGTHDPALALLDSHGTPLFAEATERSLQSKRAHNCPPDLLVRIPRLIERFVPPEAEISIAVGWSQRYFEFLATRLLARVGPWRDWVERGSAALTRDHDPLFWGWPRVTASQSALLSSLNQAGLNLTFHPSIRQPTRLRRFDHHLAHAANGCFTSPFREAVCAVVDGYGEWTSCACYHYRDGRLQLLRQRGGWRPSTGSLGLFYSTVCRLIGFDPIQGEEWKVMGLAAHGEVDPRLQALLGELVEVRGLGMERGCSTRRHWEILRSLQRGGRSDPLQAADLARSGQEVFEQRMEELLHNLFALGLSENLVFSGGCALNSRWNGRILGRTAFRRLHIPSAPADDGNALGAAFLAFGEDHPGRRPGGQAYTPYLGTAVSESGLDRLVRHGSFGRVSHLPGSIAERVAALLADGKIVGRMQGRAEFGPRALGQRSILADPRSPAMKDRINDGIKFRESFRPFAPAILYEHGATYFEDFQASPYMERALRFRPEVRDRVPAVVHIDGTGRLQTVDGVASPGFYELLSAFHRLTGVPMLLNTSFNVMGKPIIHSPEDAVGVFQASALDAMVIEDFLFEK